jgi:hypothetical protein
MKELLVRAVDEAFVHSVITAFDQYVENESSGKQTGEHAETKLLRAMKTAQNGRTYLIRQLGLENGKKGNGK